MPDNVSITAGSGTVIATDEVVDGTLGTVQVQFTKLMDGTLNGTNKAVVGANGALSVQTPSVTATQVVTAAAQAATITVPAGVSTAHVQVTGTMSATFQFEGTIDGTNWYSVFGVVSNTSSGSINSSTTTIGSFTFDIAGLAQFRVRCSAFTSGTALTIVVRASVGTGSLSINRSLPSGTAAIGTVSVTGTGAAAATIAGNPVRLGGTARTANPTAVTDGQTSNVMTDKMGRLVVVQGQFRNAVVSQATTITSSVAATTIVSAGAAGVFRDITHLSITNGSATATIVTLTGSAGALIWNLPAGGGMVTNFSPPLTAAAAAATWTLTCGTSVASVYANVVYVENL